MHDFNKSDRETMNAKQQIIDTWGFNWKETTDLAVVKTRSKTKGDILKLRKSAKYCRF